MIKGIVTEVHTEGVGRILKCERSNCAERFCGSFFLLSKVALTFESVDEIVKCDHSVESY